MEIKVIRKWPRNDYIIGRLFIDDKFYCHTMEPPHHGKHTCIPTGAYEVEMYPSAKFHAMRPIIKDVKGRSGILIHEGNYPRDTQGCILVGTNARVGTLSFSRSALSDIIAALKRSGNHATIIIKEEF